jgi:tetratricopeptide (TPR) repeat protein
MATTGTGYGFGAAAAILGVSESRLRYWSQVGFVGPSTREQGKQVYSFQDLAAVKAAKELVDRGFSTADIRKAIDRVRASLPDIDRPLEHLRVAFDGKELVLVEDGAAFALSGQRVFDFGLGELRARATGWGRTTPTPLPANNADRDTPVDNAFGWFQEGLAREREGDTVSGTLRGSQAPRDGAPASKPPAPHAFDKAAAAYRRALKLDPGLAAAHTNLGRLAHRRGDVAEARGCFEAALALDPDQPEARYNLAHLLVEAGEMDVAAAELRRVLQLDPAFADAHFNLATALEALGGRRQARDHLIRFLELTATGTDAGADDAWRAEAQQRLAAL